MVSIEPKSDGAFIRNVRIRANCYFMIETRGEPFRNRSGPKSNRDIGPGIAVQGKNFEIRDCDVLFRRNTCRNNASISIAGNLHGALVEHNVVEHTDVGVRVRRPASGVLLRANRFEEVPTPTTGDGLATATIAP